MELIICEKPAAAKRIAIALGKKISLKRIGMVPYYEIEKDGIKILVAGAVGHLYGLAEAQKTSIYNYPTFDAVWKPIFEISKKSYFAKKFWQALRSLAAKSDKFIVACDYDIEGEVIGLNILRFICNVENALRMKFSTLTPIDLKQAYANALPTIDLGQALAGETRHYLDYFWGINLSRALISSLYRVGIKKILSIGRVQGPALKLIYDREKEIATFVPKPFWQIFAHLKINKKIFKSSYLKNPLWQKEAFEALKQKFGEAKKAKIEKIEIAEFAQLPPPPFDLTSLQLEAYRIFGIGPKETLQIAEELYLAGLISYPRTASQKLPPTIGYKNIITKLSAQKNYAGFCEKILKLPLKPVQGKLADPAHPAIFPTGIKPGKLEKKLLEIYDLIVRRFLACFALSAKKEKKIVTLNINGEFFILKGMRTIDKGWLEIYTFYKPEEIELPKLEEGQILNIEKIEFIEDTTKPPKRYTPASIVKELEKRNLGTKATRAEIIDTLYKRQYIFGEQIKITKLGAAIIEVLSKYCSKILDEALTRHFEEDIETVRQKKKEKEKILDEAKEILTEILKEFKEKESEIGSNLKESLKELINVLGDCACGGKIIVKIGKKGRFATCNRYPECKIAYPLPKSGLIVPTVACEACGAPKVKLIRKGKGAFEFCINLNCSRRLKR